jgi:hypothetical protein
MCQRFTIYNNIYVHSLRITAPLWVGLYKKKQCNDTGTGTWNWNWNKIDVQHILSDKI